MAVGTVWCGAKYSYGVWQRFDHQASTYLFDMFVAHFREVRFCFDIVASILYLTQFGNSILHLFSDYCWFVSCLLWNLSDFVVCFWCCWMFFVSHEIRYIPQRPKELPGPGPWVPGSRAVPGPGRQPLGPRPILTQSARWTHNANVFV